MNKLVIRTGGVALFLYIILITVCIFAIAELTTEFISGNIDDKGTFIICIIALIYGLVCLIKYLIGNKIIVTDEYLILYNLKKVNFPIFIEEKINIKNIKVIILATANYIDELANSEDNQFLKDEIDVLKNSTYRRY